MFQLSSSLAQKSRRLSTVLIQFPSSRRCGGKQYSTTHDTRRACVSMHMRSCMKRVIATPNSLSNHVAPYRRLVSGGGFLLWITFFKKYCIIIVMSYFKFSDKEKLDL